MLRLTTSSDSYCYSHHIDLKLIHWIILPRQIKKTEDGIAKELQTEWIWQEWIVQEQTQICILFASFCNPLSLLSVVYILRYFMEGNIL